MDADKFKQVEQKDFEEFIKRYPGGLSEQYKLTYDWTGITEPALESWNDFRLGIWPDSVVAYAQDDWQNNKGYKYYILREVKNDGYIK